jgi:hypothetical protein
MSYQQPSFGPPTKKRWLVPVIVVGAVLVLCCGIVAVPAGIYLMVDNGPYSAAQVEKADLCHAIDPALLAQLVGPAAGVPDGFIGLDSEGNQINNKCSWSPGHSQGGLALTMEIRAGHYEKQVFSSAARVAHSERVHDLTGRIGRNGAAYPGPNVALTGVGEEGWAYGGDVSFYPFDLVARRGNVVLRLIVYSSDTIPAGQGNAALSAFLPAGRQALTDTFAKL